LVFIKVDNQGLVMRKVLGVFFICYYRVKIGIFFQLYGIGVQAEGEELEMR
jgi:hypothetical protein